jgi:hypothetical protein
MSRCGSAKRLRYRLELTHSCLSRMAALGKPIARGGFLRYSDGFISSYCPLPHGLAHGGRVTCDA